MGEGISLSSYCNDQQCQTYYLHSPKYALNDHSFKGIGSVKIKTGDVN